MVWLTPLSPVGLEREILRPWPLSQYLSSSCGILTFEAPTPQNVQTHSSNSSTTVIDLDPNSLSLENHVQGLGLNSLRVNFFYELNSGNWVNIAFYLFFSSSTSSSRSRSASYQLHVCSRYELVITVRRSSGIFTQY